MKSQGARSVLHVTPHWRTWEGQSDSTVRKRRKENKNKICTARHTHVGWTGDSRVVLLLTPVLGQFVDNVAHHCQGPDGACGGAEEVGLAGALFVVGVGIGPGQVAMDG